MHGYALDGYASGWAELAAAHIDGKNLDRAGPFTTLGAGRMEDFELLREFVVYATGGDRTTEHLGAPDCRLPNDGSYNLYDEDPVAHAFLQASLPPDVKRTVDEAVDGDASPSDWVEAFQENGEEWAECFGTVMRDIANDLHLEALLLLRGLLETRGYSLADDCSIELIEHDSITMLADEPGYEKIAVGQEFQLGPWLPRSEAMACLFFDSPERRQAFLARVRE